MGRSRAFMATIEGSRSRELADAATARRLARPERAFLPELQSRAGNRAVAQLLSMHAPAYLSRSTAAAAGNGAMRSVFSPAVQRATALPTGCATYGRGEVRKSRGAGFLAPDVSLTRAPAGSAFDPVVIGDFAVGRGSVKSSTAGELRAGKWIDILERQADKKLEFVGYTDCVGAEASNSTLREERARAVANLFPKAGANASFVGAAPSDSYLAGNVDAAGRARNRGVIIRAPAPAAKAPTKPKPKPAPGKPTWTPKGRLRVQDAFRSQLPLLLHAAKRAAQAVDQAVGRLGAPVPRDTLGALDRNMHNVHGLVEPKVSAMGEIRSGLAKLRATFDETIPVEVEPDADKNTRAYVYGLWSDLHFRPLWFQGTNPDARAKTFLHEMCHKYLSIDRDTYRWNDGPNRKEDNPAYAFLSTSDALDNADSWAWLCLDLLIHPSGWPPKW